MRASDKLPTRSRPPYTFPSALAEELCELYPNAATKIDLHLMTISFFSPVMGFQDVVGRQRDQAATAEFGCDHLCDDGAAGAAKMSSALDRLRIKVTIAA